MVTAALGQDGAVEIFNGGSAPVNVVVDVTGWYTTADTTGRGQLASLAVPERVLDTRAAVGRPGRLPVPAGGVVNLALVGTGRPLPAGVGAVVLNVTATQPTAPGYVTVWPDGPMPLASSLNFAPDETIPNLVTVPVSRDGLVRLSSSAQTHLVADLVAWYEDDDTSDTGGRFYGQTPTRIWDSREEEFPVQPGEQVDLQVLGEGSVPPLGVTGVVLSIAGIDPTAATYITVWPAGEPRPTSSNLNLVPGHTSANAVVTSIGEFGVVSIYNDLGETDFVVDIVGWFTDDGLWHP